MLDFGNREILLADGIQRPTCIIIPNVVKITQTIVEILRFFFLFKMAAATILEFGLAKFY